MALDDPTAITIASSDAELAKVIQEEFTDPAFRVYTNPDVTGCELAIVLGLPDTERGQIVAAVLVEPRATEPDDDALRLALRDRLSAYKVPRRFLRLSREAVPMLSSGKPDFRRLVECFDAG